MLIYFGVINEIKERVVIQLSQQQKKIEEENTKRFLILEVLKHFLKTKILNKKILLNKNHKKSFSFSFFCIHKNKTQKILPS